MSKTSNDTSYTFQSRIAAGSFVGIRTQHQRVELSEKMYVGVVKSVDHNSQIEVIGPNRRDYLQSPNRKIATQPHLYISAPYYFLAMTGNDYGRLLRCTATVPRRLAFSHISFLAVGLDEIVAHCVANGLTDMCTQLRAIESELS